MAVPATCYSIFDIRCSNCKKSGDPRMFTSEGKLDKTCNICRARARQRRRARVYDNLSPEFRAHLGSRQYYHDTDDDVDDANAALSLSSSAASVSTTSADYFVDEPDPEPEP